MAKEPVKVWSTVGVTLPIPDTYANIKFSFGHQRFAKSDNPKDLTAVEEDMYLFNLNVLNNRLEVFRIEVEKIVNPPKKKKGKKK